MGTRIVQNGPETPTQKVVRTVVVWVVAGGLMFLCSVTGCRTNDGNPNDKPSKGFDKCLNQGDC